MKPNFRKDFPNHFKLPERISRLEDLAYNLWWAWNPDGMRLFLQLDRQLWEKINHNPEKYGGSAEKSGKHHPLFSSETVEF